MERDEEGRNDFVTDVVSTNIPKQSLIYVQELEPGYQYYYCYLVDGERRFDPNCEYVSLDADSIANFIHVPGKFTPE